MRLKTKDKFSKKQRSTNRTAVPTGRYNKFSKAHTDHLNELKTDMTGVVKTVKKTIKAAPKRNPTGTLQENWKCLFFHRNYCIKLGHTGCRAADFHMHTSSKEERDAAIKYITEEAITIDMPIVIEGKDRFEKYFFSFY